MKSIRDEIVTRRRKRIAAEGHTLGVAVPTRRSVPLEPLLGEPALICEVKRRSPSRGAIDAALDPVELTRTYVGHGARSISVLTEEDYFHGSLADLMAVKRAHPHCAVLRKDFLLDSQDIDVSFRAGADAVLLIAAILERAELAALIAAAEALGMTALVELHDETDVAKVSDLRPHVIGINARNLSTFNVDLFAPLRLHHHIDWEHTAVFESGIFTREDARFVGCGGFDAILVGEAVVRSPERIPEITSGLSNPRHEVAVSHPRADFWSRLAAARNVREEGRPLVKICGITNRADALLAVELGADMLGFVFAESPRRAETDLLGTLTDIPALKVAVVVSGGSHGPLDPIVANLLSDGLIDAIQFHGDELPIECSRAAFPYYKALRLGSPDDASALTSFASPRVLVDARSSGAYGGTGKRLSPEIVAAASEAGPLWLAGGISDENIASIVCTYAPELVDVSSGLEKVPGKKDPDRLRRFFKELTNA